MTREKVLEQFLINIESELKSVTIYKKEDLHVCAHISCGDCPFSTCKTGHSNCKEVTFEEAFNTPAWKWKTSMSQREKTLRKFLTNMEDTLDAKGSKGISGEINSCKGILCEHCPLDAPSRTCEDYTFTAAFKHEEEKEQEKETIKQTQKQEQEKEKENNVWFYPIALDIPDGYKPTGEYRAPKVNEPFLDRDKKVGNHISTWSGAAPWIILEKIEETMPTGNETSTTESRLNILEQRVCIPEYKLSTTK